MRNPASDSRKRIGVMVVLSITGCGRVPEPAQDTASVAPPAAPQLTGTPAGQEWRFVRMVTPVETIEAPATGRYTLNLGDSNRVTGMADCNRMAGSYSLNGSAISFEPLITTRMACPEGGIGTRYVQWLEAAAGWFFRSDTLFVDLRVDSGTMRFVRNES